MTLSLLCLTLFFPTLTLSLNAGGATKSDIRDGRILERRVELEGGADGLYEPQFASVERMVVTRQTDNLNALGNNDPERFSMGPGEEDGAFQSRLGFRK